MRATHATLVLPLVFAVPAREYDAIVYVDSTRATQPNHPDR